jgi:hypothetical protein
MALDHGLIKQGISKGEHDMLKKMKAAITGPTFLAAILPAIIVWTVTGMSIASYAA